MCETEMDLEVGNRSHKASFSFACLQTRMDTLNTYTHKDTHPTYHWVFEQRVLALANRSVHSSSCSPLSFPRQAWSLSAGQQEWYHFTWAPACLIPCFPSLRLFLHAPIFLLFLALFVFSSMSLQTSSFLPQCINPSQSTPRFLPPSLFLHQSIHPSLFFLFHLS